MFFYEVDTIGTPNFTGGMLTLSDQGYLSEITFYYDANNDFTGWDLLKPCDLFVDVGADGDWEYVVKVYDPAVAAGNGYYPIYELSEIWKLNNFNLCG